jgi:hypothetical protein
MRHGYQKPFPAPGTCQGKGPSAAESAPPRLRAVVDRVQGRDEYIIQVIQVLT